jgi:hypothetical protein
MSMRQSGSPKNDTLQIYQEKFDSMKGSILLRPADDLNGKRSSSIKMQYEVKNNCHATSRGIKIVEHNEYSTDIAHRGRLYIPAKAKENPQLVPSLRQFHNDHRPTESISGLSSNWTGKVRLVPSVSDMYAVEGTMGRKPLSDKTGNEMLIMKDGDSSADLGEGHRGFLEKGYHITGSHAYSRDGRAKQHKKSDVLLESTAFKSTITYSEKKRMELLSCELEELRGLSNGSELFGQTDVSWEQRTGAYLVKPEDEDY